MKDIAIGKKLFFFNLSHSFFLREIKCATFQSGFGQTALLEIKDNTEVGSKSHSLISI